MFFGRSSCCLHHLDLKVPSMTQNTMCHRLKDYKERLIRVTLQECLLVSIIISLAILFNTPFSFHISIHCFYSPSFSGSGSYSLFFLIFLVY